MGTRVPTMVPSHNSLMQFGSIGGGRGSISDKLGTTASPAPQEDGKSDVTYMLYGAALFAVFGLVPLVARQCRQGGDDRGPRSSKKSRRHLRKQAQRVATEEDEDEEDEELHHAEQGGEEGGEEEDDDNDFHDRRPKAKSEKKREKKKRSHRAPRV